MTDWKYDADQHDPLTALRIPVTSAWPGYRYTACFDRESEARPTDAEARMIASYIEQYQQYFFGDGWWRKKQLAQDFDMDCYTTKVFHKWADGDWSFRCVTWQSGVFWAPVFPRQRGGEFDTTEAKGPMTLEQVMDYTHHIGSKYPSTHWLEWKAARPDIFAPAEPAATPAEPECRCDPGDEDAEPCQAYDCSITFRREVGYP